MKNFKKIASIIFILIMGLFILTGCSGEDIDFKEQDSETKATNSIFKVNKNETKEEKMKEIEKEVLGITEGGDYVIKLKNPNNKQVYIENITVNFFDENDIFQKKEYTDDSYFCIPANSELITYIWGYGETFEEYAKSEINISKGDPFYTYYTENLEVKANDSGDQIAVEIVNNNNSDLDCIEVNVAFFRDGKIVGIESGLSYYEGIGAKGGKAYINVDYPYDSNYDDVVFDEFQVYIVSAYKE